MKHHLYRQLFVAIALLCLVASVHAQEAPSARADDAELVNLHEVDPTIVIDLRYAGMNNVAHRPLYPPNMPALVRPDVAEKLVHAQNELLPRGFRLKIWDAWRPKSAHDELWRLFPNKNYVGNPNDGFGSLHTWGVAVDATMVDDQGRDVAMPTDFDAFTPAAMLVYTGKDPQVARNLHTLQRAMAHAGFWGMRTEWWHFISRGWTKYRAIAQLPIAIQSVDRSAGAAQASAGGSR